MSQICRPHSPRCNCAVAEWGAVLEWLPLATANRNPSLAELIHVSDGEDMYEDFQTRPVLDLT